MSTAYVLAEKSGGVGTLTLNDPEKMNALSKPVADALLAALESMWYDRSVRVIVIRGANGTFSAGGDVKGMADRVALLRQGKEPPVDPRSNLRNLNRLSEIIRCIDKPVVACVEGAAAGGGLSLAMVCDFSIAEENTKCVFAFANIALAPDMGSSVLLTNRVGAPRATELLMTGRRFTGREAADWGIMTEAVPSGELEGKVARLTEKLASGPSGSYAAVKEAINRTMYQGFFEAMETETQVQAALIRKPSHWEAVDAFLEKRKPDYNVVEGNIDGESFMG